MGLKIKKSLSHHLTTGCFYIPTNTPSHRRSSNIDKKTATSVLLISYDGRVQVYHRPVLASELMKEYPDHLICRSDDCFIGRKVPPLASEDQLHLGQSYFLLPSHLFLSVLSFVSLATANGSATAKKRFIQPFVVHLTSAGTLQIRVSDEFILHKVKEEEEKRKIGLSCSNGRVLTNEELEKEYRMLVRSKRWSPKLDTIGESSEKKNKGPKELVKHLSFKNR